MSRRKRTWSKKAMEAAQRQQDRAKRLIESGETYRSQAPSTWSRTAKPSGGRLS